jgi:F0F1-type ATP synthase beta subunit
MADNGSNVGKIVQVIGPVIDVEFDADHMPGIYNAVTVKESVQDIDIDVVAEVQQHLGRNQVRAVAMSHHRRTQARHEDRSTPERRSRCRSAARPWAAFST